MMYFAKNRKDIAGECTGSHELWMLH
jgi:hypothetical protein